VPLPLSVYVFAGMSVLALLIGGAQQVRVWHAQHETSAALEQTAKAKQDLADYQSAAAAEIIKRLEENQQIEAAGARKVQETTSAFNTSYSALRVRYDGLRASAAKAHSGSGPVPAATVDDQRTVDAAPADTGELPRCVQGDRRDGLIDILATADECAQKLASCQEYVRGIK